VSPVSFAGPTRIHPPAISKESLPRIDFVLVSHDHYDHLDKDFVQFLGGRTTWIVPTGVKATLMSWDIPAESIIELGWHDSANFGSISVTSTPAQHFSGRGLFDRNSTLWCSYAVAIGDFRFWFGGDTGYNDVQFKAIGQEHGPFDLAIIPIGAYKPRWFMKSMHIDPAEAVTVHKEVRSKLSVASHWGTLKLSSEGVLEPVVHLQQALEEQGLDPKQFVAMPIGATMVLSQ